MRITNQMISNNSLRNLQTSTAKFDALTQQLTTGQKIQRASEDPVVAVRALKLRNTVSQLTQFKEKNIKDADSWMELTENSITSIANYIEYMSSYCNQGATDSFNNDNRSAIAENIRAYKNMIYSEGNTTYAGRYIFSGYKTDTSLIFDEKDAANFSYTIKEQMSGKDILVKTATVNEVNPQDLDEYLAGNKTYGTAQYPEQQTVYRLRLSYDNLSEGTVPTVQYIDDTGTEQTLAINRTMASTESADYYKDLGEDEVRYIPETGEIVFGKEIYSTLQHVEAITVEYEKEEFVAGELRPEHYFDCTMHNKTTGIDVEFTSLHDIQSIEYEVNFNQKIRVNTLGRDLITHDIGRTIDELADKVTEVADAEARLTQLKGLLSNPKYSGDEKAVQQINYMIADAENEVKMKNQEMRSMFNAHIGIFQEYQTDVTSLQSDAGARSAKLEMISTRVAEQYINFTDLMSTNEEVDYEEKAIDYSSTAIIYNAALQVTGSVLQKSLLDFI